MSDAPIMFDDSDEWESEGSSPLTPWAPKDDSDAAENLRRQAFYSKRLDELTAVKLSQIDQIDRWYQKEAAKIQEKIDGYRIPLERYATERVATQKAKTLSYPAGSIQVRSGLQSVEVLDQEALIAFAKAHPQLEESLIRTPPPVPVPAKDVIKAALKSGGFTLSDDGSLIDSETGEIVDGVSIKTGEPSVKVTFTEVADV